MLIIMNLLIGIIIFGGYQLVKSTWSTNKLKAVAIIIIDLLVIGILAVLKNSMKSSIHEQVLDEYGMIISYIFSIC